MASACRPSCAACAAFSPGGAGCETQAVPSRGGSGLHSSDPGSLPVCGCSEIPTEAVGSPLCAGAVAQRGSCGLPVKAAAKGSGEPAGFISEWGLRNNLLVVEHTLLCGEVGIGAEAGELLG